VSECARVNQGVTAAAAAHLLTYTRRGYRDNPLPSIRAVYSYSQRAPRFFTTNIIVFTNSVLSYSTFLMSFSFIHILLLGNLFSSVSHAILDTYLFHKIFSTSFLTNVLQFLQPADI